METRGLSVKEILEMSEFADFYRSAADYCQHIENYQPQTTTDFLIVTRQKLIRLYDTALKLSWVDLKSNVDYDEKLDDNEFSNVLTSLSKRLADCRFYWHVFDPSNEKDTAPVYGDLLDDLGDIYKDLKYTIMIFNLNKTDCKENALWQFKWDFEKHWGDHCVNALYAIHYFSEREN